MNGKVIRLGILAAAIVTLSLPATAQTTSGAAAEPKKRGSRLLEEVMVTAQKREEDASDVPISIQAFGAEKLDALGVDGQDGLQAVTPSLTVGSQAGFTVTYLRGVGSDAFLTSDPSVTTYVDGVYFPFAYNLGNNFGGVDRIEILKGPQGTLFGRNATGGAINVVTKKPEFEEFFGEVYISYGNYGDLSARLRVNIPITDQIAFSLSGFQKERDTYFSNSTIDEGRSLPKEEADGWRAKLRFQPNDSLDATISYWKFGNEGAGSHFACVEEPTLLGAAGGIEGADGYKNCNNDGAVYTQGDSKIVYGELEYFAPWFDMKILGSDQTVIGPGLQDFDGSPEALVELSSRNQRLEAVQAEIQFLSNGEVGPAWLQWIVGANYYEGKGGFFQFDTNLAGLSTSNGELFGLQLPSELTELLTNLNLAIPGTDIEQVGVVGTEALGVFVQTTMTVTDWLDITLGARYQNEERSIIESSAGLLNLDGSVTELRRSDTAVNNITGEEVPGAVVSESLKPKVSFELRPFDDDTLVYLSYQEAIKGGTYNVLTLYADPSYVVDEEIEAIELGIKTQLFDGLVQFNGAFFNYDITNLQTQFVSAFEGGIIAFYNAEEARSYGFDFDGIVQLFPSWIDDLVLTGGAAFIKAEYTKFTNGSGYAEGTGLYEAGQDYSGNQIVRSPDVTASLTLSKTWYIYDNPLEVSIDGYYSSEQYYDTSNVSTSLQEAYSTYGARISYLYEPWQMRLTAFGKNLGDELYQTGGFGSDFGFKPNYGPPRLYGMKMSLEF